MSEHDRSDAPDDRQAGMPAEAMPAPGTSGLALPDLSGASDLGFPLGGFGGDGGPSGGIGDLLGGLDLGGLLDMAGQMQQHIAEAQEQAASTVLEGAAGGGMVKVTVTGDGEFRAVTIAPEVVDPDDIEMLQDLVLAAVNDAMARVHALQAETFGDPGAGGLGGLGGILGGLG